MAVRERVGMRGEDLQDSAMPPYKPVYRKAKAKKGGVTGIRNLALTGKFLRSLHAYGATRKRVKVGFKTDYGRTLAEAHGKRAEFLGLSPKNRHKVREILRQRLKEALKDWNFTKRK